MSPGFLRTKEFAEAVGFGGWRSLRPICEREGIGHKINGQWYFAEADVERARQATRVQPGEISNPCHTSHTRRRKAAGEFAVLTTESALTKALQLARMQKR